jgi:hypothetical protein
MCFAAFPFGNQQFFSKILVGYYLLNLTTFIESVALVLFVVTLVVDAMVGLVKTSWK